jgi:DNA-binding NtrC family response regulator
VKILIVDDEMAALAKMKALLKPYGECTLSSSVAQALQFYKSAIENKTPFDLVTIDIKIGDADGNDLLQQINQLELKELVPAAKKIMITAVGTKENLFKAYSRGCAGFLVKPVKRDVLEQNMTALGFTNQAPEAKQEPEA